MAFPSQTLTDLATSSTSDFKWRALIEGLQFWGVWNFRFRDFWGLESLAKNVLCFLTCLNIGWQAFPPCWNEEERSERSDSKGPFLLSSFRLSSPSSPPFAARLLWWKLGREEKGRKQQSVSLLWFSPSSTSTGSGLFAKLSSLLYNSKDTKSITNLAASLPVPDVRHSNTLFHLSAWSCDAHVFTKIIKITRSTFSFVGYPMFS